MGRSPLALLCAENDVFVMPDVPLIIAGNNSLLVTLQKTPLHPPMPVATPVVAYVPLFTVTVSKKTELVAVISPLATDVDKRAACAKKLT